MKKTIGMLIVLMNLCGKGYPMYSNYEGSEKELPYSIDQKKIDVLRGQKITKLKGGKRVSRNSGYYKRKARQNQAQFFYTDQDGNQVDLSTRKKRFLYCAFTLIDLLGEYSQQ